MEVDLAWRGVDLCGALADRRVRFLLNLIDHLPRASYTHEAMANDDELIEQTYKPRSVLDEDADGPARPRLAEFDPHVEQLYNLVDRLGDVVSGLVRLGGGKAPHVRPLRRPETAYDRLEARHNDQLLAGAKARLLPNG